MTSPPMFLSQKRERDPSQNDDLNSDSKTHNLTYTIDSWSSYINNFHPMNILSNITISNSSSKWSLNSLSKGEFLLLKLEQTSIVQLITFGKFNDQSALKEFKLYSGLTNTDMHEILHSHLSDETGYETLAVNDKYNNIPILSNYIKLVPLKPKNPEFNISVWFINLRGITDASIIQSSMKDYLNNKTMEKQTLWLNLTRELLLDQFQESKYYNDIIAKFENENVTRLYNSITNGDYEEGEKVINILQRKNLLIIKDTKWSVSYKKIDFVHQEMINAFEGVENEIKINVVRAHNKHEIDNKNDNEIVCLLGEGNNNNNNSNRFMPFQITNANNIAGNDNYNGNNNNDNDNNNDNNNNEDAEVEDEDTDEDDVDVDVDDSVNSNSIYRFPFRPMRQIRPIRQARPSRNISNSLRNQSDLTNQRHFIDSFSNNLNNLFDIQSRNRFTEETHSFESIITDEFQYSFTFHDNSLFRNHTTNNNIEFDNSELSYPCPRGGHILVIDNDSSLIYLFGGWNGEKELADFWVYDIINNSWRLLSKNTLNQNGPSARTCHKAVFDKTFKRILFYGSSKIIKGDNILYIYNITHDNWSKKVICQEMVNSTIILTKSLNAVYDHQMVFDSNKQIFYLFGGVSSTNTNSFYLGLWKLDMRNDYWENLLHENSLNSYDLCLKERSGHSMMFDEDNNELIIFGGGKIKQKPPCPIYDIIIYEITTGKLREIYHDYSKVSNGPNVFYSNGTYYNSQEKIIYIFGGIQKGYNEMIPNTFWVFDMTTKQFHQCSPNENSTEMMIDYDKLACAQNGNNSLKTCTYDHPLNCDTLNIPIGRFAHSVIYSEKLGRGFIYGGNPNDKVIDGYRLNDFWQFELRHYSQENISKEIKAELYGNYYLELLGLNKHEEAIHVLNSQLVHYCNETTLHKYSELLIHYDPYEYNVSQDQLKNENKDNSKPKSIPDIIKEKRRKLYEKLVAYIKDA